MKILERRRKRLFSINDFRKIKNNQQENIGTKLCCKCKHERDKYRILKTVVKDTKATKLSAFNKYHNENHLSRATRDIKTDFSIMDFSDEYRIILDRPDSYLSLHGKYISLMLEKNPVIR